MINIMYLHAGAEFYGADKVLLDLVTGLDKNIFNPIVVLPCEGVLVDKLKDNNIKVEVLSYPILRRKYFNIKGIINYVKNYFYYSKKLIKIAKDNEINIIHINTAAVLEGIFIKLRLKKALLWHIHEIIVNPKFLSKFLSKIIARFSNKVIVVSNAVKQHLEQEAKFKNNLQIIYNGVDNNIYNPNNSITYLFDDFKIPKESIRVGMVGRVNSWKGQKDFLEAMTPILKKEKSVYAILVGGVFEGEEYRLTNLKKYINSLDVKKQIIISDFRSDSKNIHNFFDIFVLPSTNPDPLPTVVLEAMASAKPIVAYRHGGVCEMVKENYNGFFAEVKNFNSLSEQIEKLIVDKEKMEKFGKHSLERQKELFSLQNYINNFEEIYKGMIK